MNLAIIMLCYFSPVTKHCLPLYSSQPLPIVECTRYANRVKFIHRNKPLQVRCKVSVTVINKKD